MRRLLLFIMIGLFLVQPVAAEELMAPSVPGSAEHLLPEEPDTFTEGLLQILSEVIPQIQPSLTEAFRICVGLISITLLISLVESIPGKSSRYTDLAGTLAIGAVLLRTSNSLIGLGAETVNHLSEYGKLLLPVMTAAMAAQGGTVSSAALYAGTAFFDAILCSLISNILVPMIYVFLCLAAANSAIGEDILKKMRDFVRWLVTWSLKIILYIFTGYMTVTGVVSGGADAAAVKATKLTISGMVPVVGSILSDASEVVLVGAGVVKNAVGTYGLLAILAVWIEPFLQIGVQYLLLKATAAICGVLGTKRCGSLISDFSAAMGLLLAMTGTACLLLLISTVCFMKEVG